MKMIFLYFHHEYFLELKELVQMHGSSEETDNKENEEPLSYDEILIVKVSHTH